MLTDSILGLLDNLVGFWRKQGMVDKLHYFTPELVQMLSLVNFVNTN